jgi:hypothetical protein
MTVHEGHVANAPFLVDVIEDVYILVSKVLARTQWVMLFDFLWRLS